MLIRFVLFYKNNSRNRRAGSLFCRKNKAFFDLCQYLCRVMSMRLSGYLIEFAVPTSCFRALVSPQNGGSGMKKVVFRGSFGTE